MLVSRDRRAAGGEEGQPQAEGRDAGGQELGLLRGGMMLGVKHGKTRALGTLEEELCVHCWVHACLFSCRCPRTPLRRAPGRPRPHATC